MRKNISLYLIPLFLLLGVIGISNSVDLSVDSTNNVDFRAIPFAAANITEDTYEENDAFADAVVMTRGTYEDLAAFDADWYKVEVEAGGTIIVSITFDGDDDLDLDLYSAAGVQLAYSWYDNPEVAQYSPAEAGYVYIYVNPYAAAEYWYDMEIIVYPPLIEDDFGEYNDVKANASALTAAGTFEGVAIDDDWFSIEVEKGNTLTVALDFDLDYCDLDIWIYDANAAVANSINRGEIETCSYAVKETGTYYIKVDTWHLGPENLDYDMTVSIAKTEGGGIPGYAPFFMALAAVGTLGLLIYKRK